MGGYFVGTVGNGRLLARVTAEGSLLGLCAPQLDRELLQEPLHALLQVGDGMPLPIYGHDWNHHCDYLSGTNVLRVISEHASGIKLERRLAAIGERLLVAFRCDGDAAVRWERGIEGVVPEAAMRFDGEWPVGFDVPALAGATRAAVVSRIPDLPDTAADLYARSVLVIAQHHDRSGAFAAATADAVLAAHALDVCGERGAARAFFEWAVENAQPSGLLAWALERHLHWSKSPALRSRLEELKAESGTEPPLASADGPSAALWFAWQSAVSNRHVEAIGALHTATSARSGLGLFLGEGGVDVRAHALYLIAVHALIPPRKTLDDGFFEHQASSQQTRRARALYGGAYHPGMPEPREPDRLAVEVRSDLDVTAVTLEVAGRQPQQMEVDAAGDGQRWSARLAATEADKVTRYKIRVQLRDPQTTPVWASDSDPRPGGQEFAYESAAPAPPEWVRDALCYHVMVDRFARQGQSLPVPGDPTALYGGTLDGIREHLDHVEDLGCNLLWLSPIHRASTHHGYDVEDYFEVEPRYGGESALVRLVDDAHRRGMRVMLDFVPNHTGRGHPLFRDAVRSDSGAAAYYRFWQWPHYYRCFGDVVSLPELDTGNEIVQDHLLRAARHWLTAYGIDAIRCDHMAGVDPSFWLALRRAVREVKPDALILGEATGTSDWLARYSGRIDAIFDFFLAYYIREALGRGRMDGPAFASCLEEHEQAYPGLALATLLDNHDMNRFLWVARGSVDRLKLAATLLMTLPGMPVMYYGTEVGLSQRYDGVIENAEARLPMLWGADQNHDLLAHFRGLGRMRRDSRALRQGSWRTLLADAEVFAYERRAGDESVVVALNFSEQPQHRDLPGLKEQVELAPLGSAMFTSR